MKRIAVAEGYSDDYITRPAGERLRTAILNATRSGEPVEVDFTGLIIGSTSFLDEALAKLVDEGWDTEKFEALIRIKGLYKLDAKVLEQVRAYRRI